MIPFYVLVTSFILFNALGLFGVPLWDEWQESLRYAIGAMFLLTASAHWGKRRTDLIAMVPSAIPNPSAAVTVTGIMEIVGAVGIILPRVSLISAIGLTCLLVFMFPANVYAARMKLSIGGRPVPSLWQRTLLQIFFIIALILTMEVF
ncbi:DoxX family protein [Paenibacillus sp. LHD-117]|uniref:DoxX family protein n=1 Tax=Paenibacillus sp. LHD-117 TaxID=3071412 RepID=UPI0027E099B5|nr:DoxX family protein [Paenibacillus sp. LHD-117]MDQ6422021.1 DoxX family protein [Paenibacillus sp. LHD-117]